MPQAAKSLIMLFTSTQPQKLGIGMLKPLIYSIILLSASAALPAQADCFDDAARYQGVNPVILRAIAWQESRYRPNAMRKNDNGSTDYGLMQINSIHLRALSKYDISSNTLMEPCASVYIAAWHLRQKMNKYGNTWQAIGSYHSETPKYRDKYAGQIIKILTKWGATSQPR